MAELEDRGGIRLTIAQLVGILSAVGALSAGSVGVLSTPPATAPPIPKITAERFEVEMRLVNYKLDVMSDDIEEIRKLLHPETPVGKQHPTE